MNTHNLLRTLFAIFLSAVSGLLIFLSFPPHDLWPLVWVAFIPQILAQYRIIPRRILTRAAYPEGGEPTLVTQVPIGSGKTTIASRLGDWVGWLGLAGLIAFSVLSSRTKKQKKDPSAAQERNN